MSDRSRSLSLQALIAGRLRDGVTGEAPRTPVDLRLIDRADPDQPEVALARTLGADGTFAFFGDPEQAFTRFATEALALRLEASADRFAPTSLDLDVPATGGQPETVEVPMPPPAESPASPALFTAGLPADGLELTLQPLPVRLEGRVVVSNQPATGVGGAELDLGGGVTATADAEGRFAFADPLPLVETVDVEVSAAGFVSRELRHELAYDQPINRMLVLLRSA